MQAEGDSDAAAELHDTADEIPSTDIKEEVGSGEEIEASLKNEEQVGEETSASTHVTCLTVQPNRLLCGVSITNLNDVSRATLKVVRRATALIPIVLTELYVKKCRIFLHTDSIFPLF